MEKIQCPKCKGPSVKNGFQNTIQRYKCKHCGTRFQLDYTYRACKTDTNTLIGTLLKEGCGLRSISRILGISKNTVLSRILKIARQIKAPYFNAYGCKFEVDEVWSFVGRKTNVVWITYAIEQRTKQVIGFFVGSRSKENIRPIIDKLLLLEPNRIYTDRLNIYPGLIPKAVHRRFRYCTNTIERNNLTLRMHIKRLSRRTICYSKKQSYLEAHLKIYFWGTLQN